MSFTWRKRWSNPNFHEHIELKFATSTGVIVRGEEGARTLIVDGPGLPHIVEPEGHPLCCWNGDCVFSAEPYFSLDSHCVLCRHQQNGPETQRLIFPRFELVRDAVALNDGSLFVRCHGRCFLVRDDIDGRMEMIKEYGDLGTPGAKPWMSGIFYTDDWDVIYDDLSTGAQTVYMRFDTRPSRRAIFSDKRHACVISGNPEKLYEWDTRDRRRVFPVHEGDPPVDLLRQDGTCRGRAFLSSWICHPRIVGGTFEAFVYMGSGRFEKGPTGQGDWTAYGNRAYCLSKENVLTCYEARETPDSLVNLCARSAASLGLSDEILKAIPVELRELVSSWT